MTLQIRSAIDIPFPTYASLLNESYQDYYVPMDMNAPKLREYVARDDINLSASRVALKDEVPVGLGMLAQRGARGWIGGVGVLPSHRQGGIGRKIMGALLDEARQRGIEQVQLEVIRQNTRARALYDSLGFQQVRVLHLAEGFTRAKPDPSFKFQRVAGQEALRFYDAFHQQPNPWQRERIAVERLAVTLHAMVAIRHDTVSAYVIGVFQPEVIRFVDIACAPGEEAALQALVCELHRQYPLAAGSIINIADDVPAWTVLAALRYRPYISQYEMVLTL